MNDKSDSPNHKFLRSIALVILPPIILGFISFVYATFDNNRKARLEFVRSQIVDLYGPLYTLSKTSETVWNSLGSKHKPDFQTTPSKDEIRTWRNILLTVVDPLNERIEETLLSSKQTIRCPLLRDKLHEFFAFAESVKLIIARWKPDVEFTDLTEQGNTPELQYPKYLSDLLFLELNSLHERENKLDRDFYGLLVGHEEPDCASAPKS